MSKSVLNKIKVFGVVIISYAWMAGPANANNDLSRRAENAKTLLENIATTSKSPDRTTKDSLITQWWNWSNWGNWPNWNDWKNWPNWGDQWSKFLNY